MANSRPVYYWDDVIGDPEMLKQFDKTIRKLLDGEYTSAGIEPIEKKPGYNVFSVRINIQARLLFTTIESDGKSYLLLIEHLPTHKYKTSRFLKSGVLERYKENNKDKITGDIRAAEEKKAQKKKIEEEEESDDEEWEALNDEEAKKHLGNTKSNEKEKEQIEFDSVENYDQQFIIYNKQQKEAIRVTFKKNFKVVVSGGAGAGKSSVALQILKQTHGKRLYHSGSPKLVKLMQTTFNDMTKFRSKLREGVEFKDTRQLLLSIYPELANLTIVGYEDFEAWFTKHTDGKMSAFKMQGKEELATLLLADIPAVYQDLQLLATCKKRKDCFELGKRNTIFMGDEILAMLWDVLQARKDKLQQEKKADLKFYFRKLETIYTAVVSDEAQDESYVMFSVLNNITENFAACFDSHQNIYSYLSGRPYLLRMLGNGAQHIPLSISYRCPGDGVDLLNYVMEMGYKGTGGQADADEYTQLPLTDEQKKNRGQIRYISKWTADDARKYADDLKQKYGAAEVAIIVEDESERAEAKKLFNTRLVFTVERIKGRGYQAIIAHDSLRDTSFDELSDVIKDQQDIESGKAVHRPKMHKRRVHLSPAISKLFTKFSRFKSEMIVLQEYRHKARFVINGIKSKIEELNIKKQAAKKEEKKVFTKEQQDEQWENRIRDLIRNGEEEIAKEIWIEDLNRPAADFDKFVKECNGHEDVGPDAPDVAPSPPPAATAQRVPPKIDVSVSSAAVIAGAVNKKKATPLQANLISKNLLENLLKGTGDLVALFTKDKNNSCTFIKLCNVEECRKYTVDIAASNPEIFSGLPVAKLFELYDLSSDLRQLPLMEALMYYKKPSLNAFIQAALSELNEKDVAYLAENLFKTYKTAGNNTTTIALRLAPLYPSLFLFLLDKYPAIAPLLFKNLNTLSGAVIKTALTETQDGFKVLEKLNINNSFILIYKPEHLFRASIRTNENEDKVKTTIFTNVAVYASHCRDFLDGWLEKSEWIDYVIELYRARQPKELQEFTSLIIVPLVFYWHGSEYLPMLKLLERKPDFLSTLHENSALFRVYVYGDAKYSLFSLLCADVRYHPYLDRANFGGYKALEVEDFTTPFLRAARLKQSEQFQTARPSPAFSLTNSPEGLRKLNSIIHLRKDIRDHLVRGLFKPYYCRDSEVKMSCLFLRLQSVDKELLSSLIEVNPHLTTEHCQAQLMEKGLDFLNEDEWKIVRDLKSTLTVDSLREFMRRPGANRLFLCSSGKDNDLSLFAYLLHYGGDSLSAAYEMEPELVKVIRPDALAQKNWNANGAHATYFDLLFLSPFYNRLLKAFAQYDDFLGDTFLALLFTHGEMASGVTFFEKVLQDQELEWLPTRLANIPASASFILDQAPLFTAEDKRRDSYFDFVTRLANANPALVDEMTQSVYQEIYDLYNLSDEVNKRIAARIEHVADSVVNLAEASHNARKPDADQNLQDDEAKKLMVIQALKTNKMFARNNKNSCLFITLSSESKFRQQFAEVAKENPELFSRLGISILFESFGSFDTSKAKSKSKSISPSIYLLPILMQTKELQSCLKFWLSKLNNKDLEQLIKNLFSKRMSFGHVNPQKDDPRFISIVIRSYPEIILYLINTYPTSRSLLVNELLADLSSVLSLSESKDGCEVLSRLDGLDKHFFATIKPLLIAELTNVPHNVSRDHYQNKVTALFSQLAINDNPTAADILSMVEQCDDFFAAAPAELLFTKTESFKDERGVSRCYFEKWLREEKFHGMLLKIFNNETNAEVFVKYDNTVLSEGAAISMVCRYLPALAVRVAVHASSKIKPSYFLFGNNDSFKSRFYWLARFEKAHPFVLYAATDNKNLPKLIPAKTLCMPMPAPFSPNEKISPLEVLIQSEEGRSFIKLYIFKCTDPDLDALAASPLLFTPIKLNDDPMMESKASICLLFHLMMAAGVNGEDCTPAVVTLVNRKPELIDKFDLYMLAAIEHAPKLTAEASERIIKRRGELMEEISSESKLGMGWR